jgi:hypothetical protein
MSYPSTNNNQYHGNVQVRWAVPSQQYQPIVYTQVPQPIQRWGGNGYIVQQQPLQTTYIQYNQVPSTYIPNTQVVPQTVPQPVPSAPSPSAYAEAKKVSLTDGSTWEKADPKTDPTVSKYNSISIGGEKILGVFKRDGNRFGYLLESGNFYEMSGNGYIGKKVDKILGASSGEGSPQVIPQKKEALPTKIPGNDTVIPQVTPTAKNSDKDLKTFTPPGASKPETVGPAKTYPYDEKGSQATIAYTEDSRTRLYKDENGIWQKSTLTGEALVRRQSREGLLDWITTQKDGKTYFNDPSNLDSLPQEANFTIQHDAVVVKDPSGKVLARYGYDPAQKQMGPFSLSKPFEGPSITPNLNVTPDQNVPYTDIFGNSQVYKAGESIPSITYLDASGTVISDLEKQKDALFSRVLQPDDSGKLVPQTYWNQKGIWTPVQLKHEEGLMKVLNPKGERLESYWSNPNKKNALETVSEYQSYPKDSAGGLSYSRTTESGERLVWKDSVWKPDSEQGAARIQAEAWEAAFDRDVRGQVKAPEKMTRAGNFVEVSPSKDGANATGFLYHEASKKFIPVTPAKTYKPADGASYTVRYYDDPATGKPVRLIQDNKGLGESVLNEPARAEELTIRKAWEAEQDKTEKERPEMEKLGATILAKDIAIPEEAKKKLPWWHSEKPSQVRRRELVAERDLLQANNYSGQNSAQIQRLNQKIGILTKYPEEGLAHPLLQVDRRDPAYQKLPTQGQNGEQLRWHNNVSVRTASGDDIGFGMWLWYQKDPESNSFSIFGNSHTEETGRTGFRESSKNTYSGYTATPLTSFAPGFKPQAEKKIVLIQGSASSDHNDSAQRDKEGTTRSQRSIKRLRDRQAEGKMPVTDQTIVTTDDRNTILQSVREAGNGVKSGEAVTIILDYHGGSVGHKPLPGGFNGLNGTQNSYLCIGPKGYEQLYHRDIMVEVNKLAEKGIKVNIIFNNCHAGGGVAKLPIVDRREIQGLEAVQRTSMV